MPSIPRGFSGRLAVAIAAGLVAAAIGSIGISAQRPSVVPSGTPAPRAIVGQVATPVKAADQQLRNRHLAENGARIVNSAQATRGKPITIAGRTVQLPPDAYVAGVASHVSCMYPSDPVKCPKPPHYEIVRGNSSMWIATTSGQIISENLAPGDARAFDFIREALR